MNKTLLSAVVLFVLATPAPSQTTAITYQGKLSDNGMIVSGQYDLQFKLFDTQTIGSGTQLGVTVSLTSVQVAGGIFTVQLDFGACPTCFNGQTRYLEIEVRLTGGPSFTT